MIVICFSHNIIDKNDPKVVASIIESLHNALSVNYQLTTTGYKCFVSDFFLLRYAKK